MFRRVQVRVRSAIGQEPWLGFSALGEVHLAGTRGRAGRHAHRRPQSSARLSEAAEAWDQDQGHDEHRRARSFRRAVQGHVLRRAGAGSGSRS